MRWDRSAVSRDRGVRERRQQLVPCEPLARLQLLDGVVRGRACAGFSARLRHIADQSASHRVARSHCAAQDESRCSLPPTTRGTRRLQPKTCGRQHATCNRDCNHHPCSRQQPFVRQTPRNRQQELRHTRCGRQHAVGCVPLFGKGGRGPLPCRPPSPWPAWLAVAAAVNVQDTAMQDATCSK